SALGQLGGAKAVEALQAANANGVAGRSIHTALLRCAESLDAAAARVIYEQFYAVDQPSHLRAAGLRGLARVADDPGTLLTKAIQGKDAKLASHAIRIVADSDGNVGPLLELLPTLTPPTQALLIRALSERGDSTLSAAIVPFVGAEDENVKSAAIEALGKIGDAGAMQSLLSAAVTEDGAIRNIARASLENLPVKDEQLLRAMDFNNSASQEELIRALSARRASVATPKLIAVAASADDKGLRREALRGLRKLVQPAHLPQLFERVAAPKEESDRGAWVDAISDGVERLPDLDARARTLMAALITASPEIQNVLLPLLAKSATPGALSTVREAVKSEDKQIRDGGIRALSKWPNDDAAKDLLQIITGAEDEKHRVLATRGYLDIARGHEDSEGMYQRALAFAENNADRKHILSGLGSANSLSAFKLVADYLANGALAREAALALVQIGDALPVANSADVRPVMQRIMAEVDDEAIAKKAQAVTLKYEEFDDFILEWEGAGPFTADSYKKACDTDFEYSDADWKPVTKGMDKGMLNCETTFGGGSSRVAYLRGSVTMAADADAQLELGSDDGIKLWLNGELVREFTGNRGTSRGNDKVKVKLKAGKNEVLAKVINDGGGWGFCCRFRDPNGASLKGMSLE
ncbi:MAG: HEAT repeat protein, partial [Rhodothermales bacterium]